uniref:BEN domain-containing protein n=1 Tax=Strongyloides stercoralis TaxID=6248 RepID=A0A913IAA1_STRER
MDYSLNDIPSTKRRRNFISNMNNNVKSNVETNLDSEQLQKLMKEVQELKTIVQSLFEYKKKPDTESILSSLGISTESRKRSANQSSFHSECPPPIAPVQNHISSSLLQFPWSLLQGTIPCASPNNLNLAMIDSLTFDGTTSSNIPGARWNSPTLLESVRKIESNSINSGDNSMPDSLSYDNTDITSPTSSTNTHQMLLMMNRNNIQNQNLLNSMSVSQAASDLAKVGTSGSLQQLVQQIQQHQAVAAAAAAVTAATQSQTSPTSQVQTATQHLSSIAPVVTAALTNPSLFFPLSVQSNNNNHLIKNNGRLLTATPHQNNSCGSNSSSSISSISSNNTTPIVVPEKKKQVSDDFVKIIRQNDLSEDRISRIEIPVKEALLVDSSFRPSSEQQIIQIVLKNKKVEELEISEVMTQLCKKLAEKRVFGSKLMAQTTVAGPNHSTYNNLPIEGIIYIQHVCRKVLGAKVRSEDEFWDVFRDAMRKLAARCRRVRHARKTKSVLENSISIKKEASSDSSGDSVSDNHLNSSGDSSSTLLLPTLTQIC